MTLKIFDAHLHIIDKRFPLVANNGYLPDMFTIDDYLQRLHRYKLCGGAIVSASFQAFDQTYLLEALKQLGKNYVGVTQLPESVTDEELLRLENAGVRAIRFNLKRGGSENIRCLESMAKRIYEIAGWHVELYINSMQLEHLKTVLSSLPRVSIDHLGLSRTGLSTVIRLAEKGIRIKASGFGRVDFDIKTALTDIYAANPNSLMFGTDLPSTRAARPYLNRDVLLIRDIFTEEQAARVLYKNAMDFYTTGKVRS